MRSLPGGVWCGQREPPSPADPGRSRGTESNLLKMPLSSTFKHTQNLTSSAYPCLHPGPSHHHLSTGLLAVPASSLPCSSLFSQEVRATPVVAPSSCPTAPTALGVTEVQQGQSLPTFPLTALPFFCFPAESSGILHLLFPLPGTSFPEANTFISYRSHSKVTLADFSDGSPSFVLYSPHPALFIPLTLTTNQYSLIYCLVSLSFPPEGKL